MVQNVLKVIVSKTKTLQRFLLIYGFAFYQFCFRLQPNKKGYNSLQSF